MSKQIKNEIFDSVKEKVRNLSSTYSFNGFVKVQDRNSLNFDELEYGFEIPINILSYCHSNDLIDIDNEGGKIKLTEKGKYFMRNYINFKE